MHGSKSARNTVSRVRASGSSTRSAEADGAPGRIFGIDVDIDERTAGRGSPFRAPNQALESKDEGVHLWRAKRYLHRRPPEDPEALPRGSEVRHPARSGGQDGAVRRH